MDRIDTATKAEDLFGAGKHGFKDGDLPNAIVATRLDAEWFNAQQEEKMSIIEGAGVAPAAGNYTQLRQALKRLFGGNVTTVNSANSPFVLTADHAGLVIMDGTAGNISVTLPAVNVIAAKLEFKFYRADTTTNTATVNRAGADEFIGGATSFSIFGQGAFRCVEGDALSKWGTTATSEAASAIQSIGASVAASALTLTLNPTTLDFRSSALTSGVVNRRVVGAALSLVVTSGATLGTVNAQQSRLVLLALDNAGSIELAVINLAGGNNLDETGLISTTIMSAASDSANVAYSTVARANVPYRVVGFVDSTQAVAGTWATAPSTIQGAGGQAFGAMSGLGYGQTWQLMGGARVSGTTYYNTTGRPIMVSIYANNATSASVSILVNGLQISNPAWGGAASSTTQSACALVPPGASYSATISGTSSWVELR